MTKRESAVLVSVRERRWDDVDRLLNNRFYRELLTDPLDLAEAFALLPDEWFDRHPRHRMTRSLAATAGPRQLVDQEAFDAFARWVRSQPRPDTRDVLGIETTHLRRAVAVHNIGDALERADRIRRMITDATDTSGFHDVLPSVLLRVGQVYLQAGDFTAAADSLLGARRFADGEDPHPFDAFIRSHLALIDALNDHLAVARRRLALHIAPVASERSLAGQLRMTDLMVRALIEVSSGTKAAADEALERIHGEDGLSDMWWVGVLARARALAQWGSPGEGIALIRRRLRDHASASATHLLAGQVLAAELVGLLQLAGELDAADEVLSSLDPGSAVFAVRAAAVRQLLLRGKIGAGEELLRESCSADLRGSTAMALLLTIEQLKGRGVTVSSTTRATASVLAEGAAYVVQQVGSPLREHLLLAAFPGRAGFRSSFRYPSGTRRPALTLREQEVLSALRTFTRSTDIAAHLHVSVNTVKTHRRNLYAKLGAATRDEALDAADAMESRAS